MDDSSHGGRHARTVAVAKLCVKISGVYEEKGNSRITCYPEKEEAPISAAVIIKFLRSNLFLKII